MTDVFSREKRSEVMAQIKARGNLSTEMRFIRILRRAGITGWRRNIEITGKPDFVFPKERLCVFVDGCFWHGCKRHFKDPKTNPLFWREKVQRNIKRDRKVVRLLRRKGWKCLRIWEHDLESAGLGAEEKILSRLRESLKKRV